MHNDPVATPGQACFDIFLGLVIDGTVDALNGRGDLKLRPGRGFHGRTFSCFTRLLRSGAATETQMRYPGRMLILPGEPLLPAILATG